MMKTAMTDKSSESDNRLKLLLFLLYEDRHNNNMLCACRWAIFFNHVVSLASSPCRPLPVFQCVTLKNWEWPGDEAMVFYTPMIR